MEKLIILPSSKFNLLWDCFMAIFIVMIIFLESLKVFFLIKEENKEFFPTNTFELKSLTFFLFICDGLKNFTTAFYKKASLITEHRKIAREYISGHFLFDIISLVAFYTSTSSYLNINYSIFVNWSRLLFVLKFFTL